MMDAPKPWENLGIAAKAALIGAGPFITVGLFSMGAALPRLASEFESQPGSAFLIQLVGGILAPVFAFTSPVAGKLISRFGAKAVYLVSVLLFLIGGIGPILCDSLIPIIAFRILLGFGVAGGFNAGMTGIARVPERHRPALLGLTAFVGGAICIPLFPLVGALAEHSWRTAFLVHLAIAPLALLALALPKGERTTAQDGAAASQSSLLGGVPIPLLLIAAMVGLAMVSCSMYSPFYLASIGVDNPSRIGQLLGIMSLCSLAGSGSYGVVHRWLGTRRMLILSLLLIGAACLTLGMGRTVPIAIVGLGLLSTGLAIYSAAGYAAAIEAIGTAGNSALAMGVMNLALYGSQIFFPVLSGAVGAAAGPPAFFLLLALFMLISLGLTLRPGRPTGPPTVASA